MVCGSAPGNCAVTEMVGNDDVRQRGDRQQLVGGAAEQHDGDHQQARLRRAGG